MTGIIAGRLANGGLANGRPETRRAARIREPCRPANLSNAKRRTRDAVGPYHQTDGIPLMVQPGVVAAWLTSQPVVKPI